MLRALLVLPQSITRRFEQQIYSRGSNRAGGEARKGQMVKTAFCFTRPPAGQNLPALSGYENTPMIPRKRHGGIRAVLMMVSGVVPCQEEIRAESADVPLLTFSNTLLNEEELLVSAEEHL